MNITFEKLYNRAGFLMNYHYATNYMSIHVRNDLRAWYVKFNIIKGWRESSGVKVLAIQTWEPELKPQYPCKKLGMMVHSCNPDTKEAQWAWWLVDRARDTLTLYPATPLRGHFSKALWDFVLFHTYYLLVTGKLAVLRILPQSVL